MTRSLYGISGILNSCCDLAAIATSPSLSRKGVPSTVPHVIIRGSPPAPGLGDGDGSTIA